MAPVAQRGISVTAKSLFDLPFSLSQVESYVEHIRGLLEERECLTAEYERDNEQLRLELQQIRHQQGEYNAPLHNISLSSLPSLAS